LNSGRVVNRRKFTRYGELSTDGKTLAYEPMALPGTPTMVLEDTFSGRELLRIPQPDSQSYGYDLAPDAQTLATTTFNQTQQIFERHTFHFWERATGKECLTIPLPQVGAECLNRCLQFSPDGRLLAAFRGDDTLHVWDAVTGKELWHCRARGMYHLYPVMLFTPDSKSLITGHDDSTILIWRLPDNLWQRHHPKRAASPQELEQWWAALAGDDASKAYEAIWNFVDAAEDAVRILTQRLKPAEATAMRSVRQAIANLDSDKFAVREAAEKELTAWRERAEAALRAALQNKPSLEQRRRIERVLATFPAVVTSPEVLRHVREVRVLEYVAASGAVAAPAADATRLAATDLLKKLAGGDPEARLTQEAKAALRRLKMQSNIPLASPI
jgi:WD domain, G-beta repeat